MPYKSEKQRAFMHAQHPDIAKEWDEKYGIKIKPNKDDSKKDKKRN